MEFGYVSWLWVCGGCALAISERVSFRCTLLFFMCEYPISKQVCKIKSAKLKRIIVKSQPGPFTAVARLDIKRWGARESVFGEVHAHFVNPWRLSGIGGGGAGKVSSSTRGVRMSVNAQRMLSTSFLLLFSVQKSYLADWRYW